MNISLVTCLFVLTSRSINKKKNDEKQLKLLVKKDSKELVNIPFSKEESIKKAIRSNLKNITGSNKIHLEQVYTLGEEKFYDDNNIDIIYMGLTNEENIKKIDNNYELVDFKVIDNSIVIFDQEQYSYTTKTEDKDGSREYYHIIKTNDKKIEKKLLELLIVYKHLRFRMDNTEVCFKLLPNNFTLEDVRIVYELIKDTQVDKSNFRKKIVKYCIMCEEKISDKGYRPSQMYKFNPDSIDIWL